MIDINKIINIDVDNVKTWDYPDFVDAFICYAEWDDGTPLNDDELDELNECGEFVYEQVMNKLF